MALDPSVINQRLKELMKRDPLVVDYMKLLMRYMKKSPRVVEGILMLPHEVSKLDEEIRSKWNVALLEINTLTGDFDVQKYTPVVEECNPWQKIDSHVEDDKFFLFEPDKFYISIDLSRLGLNDARHVKRQVWDLVKARLAERKRPRSKTEIWSPARPRNDAREIGFVFHTQQDKFEKYLRWYDWHYTEKVSLRIIALMEKNTGSDGLKYLPDHIKWGQWRQRLGISIKGEDVIQKGVEKIYMAIHREHFISIEPLLDLHDCPDHGIACPGPTLCSYSKKWTDRFNRLDPPI